MAKNSIYDYSTSAGSNTDIAGIGILGTNAVNNFDDAFRTIMAQIATDVSPRRFAIQGALYGLTLTNNAGDATNDIDIAIGMATTDSTTDPRTMVLATAITKRLDAAWAVGTNQGGLDTGTIANGTYHLWLIQRSDTGVVDVLFSISASAPTMPANYDRKRRIGSILRESAAIVAFKQNGDIFLRNTPTAERASTAAQASTLLALSVPSGIVVEPLLTNTQVQGTNGSISTGVNSAGLTPYTICQTTLASQTDIGTVDGGVFTDTSRQIQFVVTIGGGTLSGNQLNSRGWIDRRGQLGGL